MLNRLVATSSRRLSRDVAIALTSQPKAVALNQRIKQGHRFCTRHAGTGAGAKQHQLYGLRGVVDKSETYAQCMMSSKCLRTLVSGAGAAYCAEQTTLLAGSFLSPCTLAKPGLSEHRSGAGQRKGQQRHACTRLPLALHASSRICPRWHNLSRLSQCCMRGMVPARAHLRLCGPPAAASAAPSSAFAAPQGSKAAPGGPSRGAALPVVTTAGDRAPNTPANRPSGAEGGRARAALLPAARALHHLAAIVEGDDTRQLGTLLKAGSKLFCSTYC